MPRIASFATREDALAALERMERMNDEERALREERYFREQTRLDDPVVAQAVAKIFDILAGVSPQKRTSIVLMFLASTIAAASKNSRAALARLLAGAKFSLEVMSLALFNMAANSPDKEDPDG